MTQNEGDFWRNTIKLQLDKIKNLRYKRIESPLTQGFPDLVVNYEGVISFIEIKSKPNFQPYLGVRPLQRIFLKEWHELGANTYLLTQVEDDVYFLTGINIPEHPSKEYCEKNSLLHSSRRGFPWNTLSSLLLIQN
jgi:hypothetical protein